VGHGGRVALIPGARGPQVVSRATARICDEDGNHKGQGLVLPMGDGVVVLTCHHVIAGIVPGSIRIALPDEHGDLTAPLGATYDVSRSRPDRDAVVLQIPGASPPARPLLHALDPEAYEGTLPKPATGYTYMHPQNFNAQVANATQLSLQVKNPGAWPNPPQRYVIRNAFRLADPTDAREGVSGAVVAYEGGVLGLAHFARAAGREQQRELYLVPLSVWAEGWDELDALIEPLIDERLRDAAKIRRVRDITVGISPSVANGQDPDLIIAGYREDIYGTRPEVHAAKRALAGKGLLIIGGPKSGKTRLAWELIREHSDAVLVMPIDGVPPAEFETAGLSSRRIVMLCDDLHQLAEQLQPLRWRNRFEGIASTVSIVATARDGLEWRQVLDKQTAFLTAITKHGRVYLSRTDDGGEDLPFELAKALARQLELSDEQFASRYAGTPGSLTVDLDDMKLRYQRLRDEQLGEVGASLLLDSVKILHAAGQAQLSEPLARAVAEQIRRNAPLADETWERLCRRTREEGFGAFNTAREFRTYHPYLERCVEYIPTSGDLDRLEALLRKQHEETRLAQLVAARGQQEPRLQQSIEYLARLEGLLQADITSEELERAAFELRAPLERLEESLASLQGTDDRQQADPLQKARAQVIDASRTVIEFVNDLEQRRQASRSLEQSSAAAVAAEKASRDLRRALVPLRDILTSVPFALEVHRPVEPEVPQPGLPALPVYVPREHDAVLAKVVTAAAAGTSGIAVLIGAASTGKTRAIWEALGLLGGPEPGWRLWQPLDPQEALAGLPGIEPRTVVWLNEAQRYLVSAAGMGEQVAALLRQLLHDPGRAPVLVLATLWPDYWAELTVRPPGGADPYAQARELLAGHAIAIRVPDAFTPAQLRQLEDAGDPRLALAAAGSRDGQVIQYLAGAPELLARYRNAAPAARALIDAAMDAGRLGMRAALPRAFLEAAAPGYLTDTKWAALSDDWLEQALHYTARNAKGLRGPLTPVRPRPARGALASAGGGPARYRLADYLDTYARRARRELIPPTSFWAAAASYADPADMTSLGQAAKDRGLYYHAARLYKQASAHGDPSAGAHLVLLLHTLHPGDQRPADWAAAHASVDNPGAVANLLHELRAVGATGQVATVLAGDPAAHAGLDDLDAVALLLDELREAGASGQVTTLASRAAAHASLDDPGAVATLLRALHEAGADDQVATVLARDPGAVASLLDQLREAEAGGQVTTSASQAVADVSLDDPGAVASLLDQLREAEADDQITILLDRDPAAHASMDNLRGVALLLAALRAAGADGQVATLASRSAAHVSLDDPGAVASLLAALREAGASAQAAELVQRLPAAGLFGLFCMEEGRAEQFRFGREADGRPAKPWAWTDLG
jgi:hypothetical protein